jgi:hypothetical protein
MDDENAENTKDWLIATEDCYFRPGAGEPWEESKSYTKNEILDSKKNDFGTHFFKIIFTEKTENSLRGYLIFNDRGGYELSGGDFMLDAEHPGFSTGYINVAYDTNLRFSLKLIVDAD